MKELAAKLKTTPDNVAKRVEQLNEELRAAHKNLEKARQSGSSDEVGQLLARKRDVNGVPLIFEEVGVTDTSELRALADAVRASLGSGAAILTAGNVIVAVSTDDMISRGIKADQLLRNVTAQTGGSGGGKPTFAQGKVGDPARLASVDLKSVVPA